MEYEYIEVIENGIIRRKIINIKTDDKKDFRELLISVEEKK